MEYCEIKYKKVAASTTDTSGGTVIPEGTSVAIFRVRLNGADPSAYCLVVWDWGGESEKIFASTKGDININLDTDHAENQVTGDGVKKLQVIIVNDNTTESPYIGGSYEAITI